MTSAAPVLAVVVPARDEQALITSCLDALRDARWQVGVVVHLVVVLDGCVDATASIVAARADPELHVVAVDEGCVGAARAVGAAVALRLRPRPTWLVSTDADTVVDREWLRTHLSHARSGVSAVAGTVRVDHLSARHPALGARWRQGYRHEPGHLHVHGANLGIDAAVYEEVGGFADLPVHEDVDLLRRVRAAGHPVIGVADLGVSTSGRLRGRAAHGFAEHLRGLSDEAVSS